MKKLFILPIALLVAAAVQAQAPTQQYVRKLEQTIERQESQIRDLEKKVEAVRKQSIQTTYGKRLEIDRRSKQPVYR